jgi:hemoglobin
MTQTAPHPAPTPTLPYDAIGGADAVSAIVARFYALMDDDPDYAPLRAMHAADLRPVAQGLDDFLTAWLGGPREAWMARNACVMSLHRDLAVTPEVAGQWVQAMARDRGAAGGGSGAGRSDDRAADADGARDDPPPGFTIRPGYAVARVRIFGVVHV